MLCGVFFFTLELLISISVAAEVNEEYAWKALTYSWPSKEFEEEAVKTGSYIPQNNLPVGLAVWKDRIFITVPRWKPGVASSLNYVMIGMHKSLELKPYPSWDVNYLPSGSETLKDNSTIVSVFRLCVDKCDRLWVIDTGIIDGLGNAKQIISPSLVIFDLKTDTLIRRYFFKTSDTKANSFLVNVVVDVNRDCSDAFAYVPDLGEYGLVVYSFRSDTSWRVEHHFFHFDPLAGDYLVGGVSFQWTDGVFGVALADYQADGSCKVYFHALSSTKEFEVSNKILQNKTASTSITNYYDFKLVGDRGANTQASSSYYDASTGVLFFTQVNRDGVACWNTHKALTPTNVALFAAHPKLLEFPNDLKIDNNGKIWILSNRLPKFQYTTMNSDEINYRILSVTVQDAITGTVCMM